MFVSIRLNKRISLLFCLALAAAILAFIAGANPIQAADTKAAQGVRLPIIMYHSMLKETARQGTYVISPDDFGKDLLYLQKKGYTTVLMKDVIQYVKSGTPLPPKPILLTFDDGYYNNYYYAYPLIQKYNMKMIISPIGYYTDIFSGGDADHPNYSYCTWEEINEMMRSGLVEFQNHTYNLHSNAGTRIGAQKLKSESKAQYESLLRADLGKMQQEMQQHTGYTPTTFVYPFGASSKESTAILKKIGFQASMGCRSKTNYITRDPECLYNLNRYLRSAGTKSEQFFSECDIT